MRIDAYPHLVAKDASREWELLPCWNQQDWGSPAKNRVRVQPALDRFIEKCRDRGLLVGLSTWFRQDRDDTRMQIRGPEDFGGIWKKTLESVAQAGLLDSILYVDLCNEYPLDVWAPFLPKGTLRASPLGTRWMREGVAVVREAFPRLEYTVSFTSEYDTWKEQDVSFLDFLELHLWMASHASDFYEKVGYHYERFDSKGYENVVDRAEPLYRQDPAHWQDALRRSIHGLAEWSRASKKAARHHRVLGPRRLQGLAAARLGLDQGAVRGGRAHLGGDGPLVRDRDEQLLRPAVPRHVARRGVASTDDRRDPRGAHRGLTVFVEPPADTTPQACAAPSSACSTGDEATLRVWLLQRAEDGGERCQELGCTHRRARRKSRTSSARPCP